jgi:aromatic-L-amino-acid decarboxylase
MANRTIAIGDIHGCSRALHSLLAVIRPERSDTLITLGDYVDRGPDSAGVINIMTDLISSCTLIPLLGNHELMMTNGLKSRREFEFWMFNGGKATVKSYGGNMNKMPMHHRTFLNFCKPWYETDTHIFVHAAYDPELPMEEQPEELLFWQHVDERYMPERHFSGKTVICGHTPQMDGEVGDLGHIKLIDTFCYGDQWLTAYDVNTGEYIQARADGMLRAARCEFSRAEPAPSAATSPLPALPPADRDSWPFTASRPSPLEMDGNAFERTMQGVVNRLSAHLNQLEAFPAKNSPPGDAELEHMVDQLSEPLPREPADADVLLDRLFEEYIPVSFNTAGPGYLAYIPGGGLPESAIGDLIASVTNRYSTVWTAAPALAQIESTVISWFCSMVGYGRHAGGFLTTGGSIANLGGIVAARVKLLGDDFRLARIYTSGQTHHCVPKAAFMAGFPKSNVRMVPVRFDQTMDLQALQKMIDADRSAGFQPAIVIGNAGTTNTGAVDDLAGIHAIAAAEDLWMHVDAAYGGFFLLTEAGRKRMKGIEKANSVVLDPHKGMFLPYGTGCLLVRNRDDLLPAFSFTSDYMPAMTGDRQREDFCEISPELSRDHRGLRIWLPVKLHGIGVFETLLQEKLDLAQWATERLQELGRTLSGEHSGVTLDIVAPPQLSIVAFRLNDSDRSLEENNELNRQWLDEINRDGAVMMTSTVLDGIFVLRICVLHFRTHIDHLQKALGIISASARKVLAGAAARRS